MESIDTSGKALVEHWKYVTDKGLMNTNTASALRAACTQVLAVEPEWQTLDLRTVNVEDLARRFQNKRSKDFTPESLSTYKKRFARAVKEFLQYADNPSAWKPPASDRPTRKEKKPSNSVSNNTNGAPAVEEAQATLPTVASGLVEYPFPLREGRLAYLKLPADLKMAEVKRLTAYLGTLAVDGDLV